MQIRLNGLKEVWKEVAAPTTFAVWLLISFVVAFAGPFGTYENEPFQWRAAYWCSVIGLAIVVAVSFRVFWRLTLKDSPNWVEDLATTGSLAATFGPALFTLNTWLEEPGVPSVIGLWQLIAIVFAIGVSTVVARRALQPKRAVSVARDRLLDRIGAPQGVRLSRVSSDNHHIIVCTSDGNERRVLMRLRDAVGEIDVESGYYIHRSHWVASEQMAEVVSNEGREAVRMPCGATVPVGPKYRPNLIKAGVLSA